MSVTELVDSSGEVMYWDVQMHTWLSADECAELTLITEYERDDD